MGEHTKRHRLYTLLEELDRARIHYRLNRVRGDTVMIQAVVPGRRYEIEVFSDGTLEVEIFGAAGPLSGRKQWTNFLRSTPMVQSPPPNFAVEQTASSHSLARGCSPRR